MNWQAYEAARQAHEAKQRAQGARASRRHKLLKGPSPRERRARKKQARIEGGRAMTIADGLCAGFWALHGHMNVSTVAIGLSLQGFFLASKLAARA